MKSTSFRAGLVALAAAGGLLLAGAGPVLASSGPSAAFASTTVDHGGYRTTTVKPNATPPSCQYGHLCVYNPGNNTVYDYYKCGLYDTNYLYGAGSYTNNETTGTIARFYGSSNNLIFSSRAFQQGQINLTPIYHIRPC